jgi:hypothetical protein
MSGMEWTIVTAIGVCLILLFVILEIFFPVQHTSDSKQSDKRDVRDHQPVLPAASARTR